MIITTLTCMCVDIFDNTIMPGGESLNFAATISRLTDAKVYIIGAVGNDSCGMALKKNLDVTIHEAFLEEILRGNWLPGQALNLDELAERYGVSRTPVQQALKRMHTQGMVVFSSKGHFSVPTFSEKEVCDIIEIRLLLEYQALTDIQRKALPVDYQTLDRLARECILSNETDDVVSARRTDLDFHRVLVEQAGNRCLSEVYDRIQGQFIVANYLLASHTRVQQESASGDHEMVLDALRAGDFSRAHSIIEAHIQGACQKILIKMHA